KKAAELSPEWATAHLYLADAYYRTRQYNLALASYQTSLKLDPKKADTLYGLGLTQVMLKDRAGALITVKQLTPFDAKRAATLQKEIDALPLK
ncbi:MAG: tetratricopeptide repeat protein, partial [Pyrinomonadaceae bacterium]|nr:tetratricopeptide repeat protein [Pyrinomonadaceae bacterium]